jgi:hypothetical protein
VVVVVGVFFYFLESLFDIYFLEEVIVFIDLLELD